MIKCCNARWDDSRLKDCPRCKKPLEAGSRAASCSAWLPAEDAPKGDTVIVGDVETTGAGWHNGRGQWFVYGSSIPMETPTHYMPFPPSPNSKRCHGKAVDHTRKLKDAILP